LKEHILALKWDPLSPPYAYFLLRDMDSNPLSAYKKFLKPGDPLNIKIEEEKLCIGHSISKEEYHFCSKKIQNTKYARCYDCEQKDFEKCFLFCDASKPFGNCTENHQAYLYCKNNECSVYLASIAEELKVGVSFKPLKRWINQGADIAVELFRARNGFEARKLEKEISSKFNISQTIRKAKKARKIVVNIDESYSVFKVYKEKILSFLDELEVSTLTTNLLHKDTFLSLYYGEIPTLTTNPIVNDVEKTKVITGTIVGVKGNLVVTKVDRSFYVSNLSKIIGFILSFSNEQLKLKRQKSLTEFLTV